jgi:hypothetical protein
MPDDPLERLLKGYRLPDVSPELDRRVMRDADPILERARLRAAAEDVGHDLLHGLGFGYVAWLIDLVTTTDAEYGVEFI